MKLIKVRKMNEVDDAKAKGILQTGDSDASDKLYRKVQDIDEELLNFIMDLDSCFALAKNAHESRINAGTNDMLDSIIEHANRIIKKSRDLQKSLDW